MHIPEHELKITFARSSGAGGQNVNKLSTKVTIHWSVLKSAVLTFEEKQRLQIKLANKINSSGEVVITAEEERSQIQNRAKAIARLQTLVSNALKVPKKRKATRPTLASKKRRIESKKQRSEIKKTRKTILKII